MTIHRDSCWPHSHPFQPGNELNPTPPSRPALLSPSSQMANIGLADEEIALGYDSRAHHLSYLRGQIWPLSMDQQQNTSHPLDMRGEMARLQNNQQNGYNQSSMPDQQLMSNWGYQQPQSSYSYPPQYQSGLPYSGVYSLPMQSSPIEIMPVSQAPIESGLALDTQCMAVSQSLETIPFHWDEFQADWLVLLRRRAQ